MLLMSLHELSQPQEQAGAAAACLKLRRLRRVGLAEFVLHRRQRCNVEAPAALHES